MTLFTYQGEIFKQKFARFSLFTQLKHTGFFSLINQTEFLVNNVISIVIIMTAAELINSKL